MSETPMMRQYREAKEACGDALLLFRMGDFYELFGPDAVEASKLLGLTLTSRDKDKGEAALPMAGFPHHQLEGYLAKIIRHGRRAAVCDQVEDPKQAKGLVRREVTRIVSAGAVVDDELLDPLAPNYLAAWAPGDPGGLAWLELSTGRFEAGRFPDAALSDELARINPAECVVPEGAEPPPRLSTDRPIWTHQPGWTFHDDSAKHVLCEHFGTASLEGFGFDDADAPAIRAAGAVLAYVQETQKAELHHISSLTPYRGERSLQIDEAARRSLEITSTLRDGRREGSLLAVIDETASAAGSRLLAEWISQPLIEIAAIEARLDAVEELTADADACEVLREKLADVYDLERLIARVVTERASPRDLARLGKTLALAPLIKAKLSGRRSELLRDLEERLDLCPEIRSAVEGALQDDCPLVSREGGFIRDGWNARLDELRILSAGGKEWIAKYQADAIATTGIPNLKVGYNRVFGYYLEVTAAHADKVPEHFIRKQTLKNAERYITPELKEYEEKVLSADDEAKSLEHELFVSLRREVAGQTKRLQAAAAVLATVDVLVNFARLARKRGYVRPRIVAEPVLEIVDGRHPVLDALMSQGQFVPNDARCGGAHGVAQLITGPNMAGKSTYIRQIALITLLAQSGCFVPAAKATVGVADRIFARVGAADELARGQSTFMVEMTETARILHAATERSLVILDEIGRGTSTYDGVSLAWAIVEYLHDMTNCRTWFATHYHELTQLADQLHGVRNLNVQVREWEDRIAFLHKIGPGAADRSYGIHVARLAGVPSAVNDRAENILNDLEANGDETSDAPTHRIAPRTQQNGSLQLMLFEPPTHPLLDKLRAIDVNDLTPLAALQLIESWQRELAEDRTAARTKARKR